MKTVRFYDTDSHLRVEDQIRNVVTFFQKSDLHLECNDNFLLLTGQNTSAFYEHKDVSRPLTPDMFSLVDWLSDVISGTIGTIGSIGTMGTMGSMGTKGSMGMGMGSTLVEVRPTTGKERERVDEIVTGGGTIVYSERERGCVMKVSGVSRTVRQTKSYAPIAALQSGQGSVMNATMDRTGDAKGVTVRVGAFDDVRDGSDCGNGVFFHWDDVGGWSVVFRTNVTGTQTDTVVPRSGWNMDRLDETGASSLGVRADTETAFFFQWSDMNDGSTKCGVIDDGKAVLCHEFRDVKKLGRSILPMRWEVEGHLWDSRCETFQSSGSIFSPSSSSGDARGSSRAFATPTTRTIQADNATYMPLVSIRLSDLAKRSTLKVKRIGLMNQELGLVRWLVLLNPVFSQTETFDSNSNSTSQSSGSSGSSGSSETSRSEISTHNNMTIQILERGIVLHAGFLSENTVDTSVEMDTSIYSNISGVSDVVTVAAMNVRGISNINVTLEWIE
jgi:hypothetical protein